MGVKLTDLFSGADEIQVILRAKAVRGESNTIIEIKRKKFMSFKVEELIALAKKEEECWVFELGIVEYCSDQEEK